ncbi:hypothetical protein LPJ72_004499, partial [Coemansia sp. Benny D160-2]
MFTVVEAKKTNSELDVRNACTQLLIYMREAYIMQWNIRHIWGLTLCGNAVRVCSFGNGHLLNNGGKQTPTADSKLFYTRSTIPAAEHLFGRHTRSFLATDTKPVCTKDTAAKNCSFVIKDSWV